MEVHVVESILKLRSVTQIHAQVGNWIMASRLQNISNNPLWAYNVIFKSNLFAKLVDCEWDEWQTGECDEPCGGGMRTNTRVPKVDAQHGGEECTGSSSITESCNVHECPGTHENIKI